MRRSMSRILSLAKKVLVILVALLVLIVPVMSVSAATDDVPHQAFDVSWYRLIDGQTITQRFPGIPSTMQILDPVSFTLKNVSVDNFCLSYVIPLAAGAQPYYELRLFTEGVDPVSVSVDTGVAESADTIYSMIASRLVDQSTRERAEKLNIAAHASMDLGYNAFNTLVYSMFMLFYVDSNGINYPDFLAMNWSDYSWRQWYFDALKNGDPNDKTYRAYQRVYDELQLTPSTNISIDYASPMTHYVLMQTYQFDSSSSSWTFMNTTDLSSSRPYGYAYGFHGQLIASSFSKLGLKADGIIPGQKGVSASDYDLYITESVNKNVRAPRSESAPSWSDDAPGGSGSGSTSGGFVSGSWYKDGGTGNPWTAFFLAPWIGLQWTWNNVFAKISLFGVSIADVVITMMVLLLAYLLIKVVKPIIS